MTKMFTAPLRLLALLALWLLMSLGLAHAATETITYFHNDVAGTPVLATDAAGKVVWKENYQPYGGRINNAPGGDNSQWFTGKPYDANTGLSYFGARYYDPVIGRFTGMDPAAVDLGNIHGLNRYSYGNNNPFRFVDPDGCSPEEWFPKGPNGEPAPIVTTGQTFGALTAYVVGAATGDIGLRNAAFEGMSELKARNIETVILLGTMGRGGSTGARSFDTARVEAFERAGMTDPSKIKFSKMDPKTGTVVEFKGEDGAKVGYDGPHVSEGPYHDTQHISWQSAGKRSAGGAKRGNIPYSGELHPSRTDIKE